MSRHLPGKKEEKEKRKMEKNKPNRPTVTCYVTHNYTTSYDRTSYYTPIKSYILNQ